MIHLATVWNMRTSESGTCSTIADAAIGDDLTHIEMGPPSPNPSSGKGLGKGGSLHGAGSCFSGPAGGRRRRTGYALGGGERRIRSAPTIVTQAASLPAGAVVDSAL